jgi:hypothetical protein
LSRHVWMTKPKLRNNIQNTRSVINLKKSRRKRTYVRKRNDDDDDDDDVMYSIR